MKYRYKNKAVAIQIKDRVRGLSEWESDGTHSFIAIDNLIPGLTCRLDVALEIAYLAGRAAKSEEIKDMLGI